jgi:hypothetical protein
LIVCRRDDLNVVMPDSFPVFARPLWTRACCAECRLSRPDITNIE